MHSILSIISTHQLNIHLRSHFVPLMAQVMPLGISMVHTPWQGLDYISVQVPGYRDSYAGYIDDLLE